MGKVSKSRRTEKETQTSAAALKTVARSLKCPDCTKDTLSISTHTIQEFFQEGILEVIYSCGECGYRSCDVYPLRASDPERLKFRVECVNDLNTRIARSSSATIRIPELEATITPGSLADGYVTNVEGLLDRIEAAFKTKKTAAAAGRVLGKLHKMREGKLPFTLIIDDPFGNSRIASRKVKKGKP